MSEALALDEAFGRRSSRSCWRRWRVSPVPPVRRLPGLRRHHAAAGRCLVRSAGANALVCGECGSSLEDAEPAPGQLRLVS